MLGSRHCFNGIADAEELISLNRMSRVEVLPGAQPSWAPQNWEAPVGHGEVTNGFCMFLLDVASAILGHFVGARSCCLRQRHLCRVVSHSAPTRPGASKLGFVAAHFSALEANCQSQGLVGEGPLRSRGICHLRWLGQ